MSTTQSPSLLFTGHNCANECRLGFLFLKRHTGARAPFLPWDHVETGCWSCCSHPVTARGGHARATPTQREAQPGVAGEGPPGYGGNRESGLRTRTGPGRAGPAACRRRTRAPHHVGQGELGALRKHAAVHGDHRAAVVVEPVPVAALLIGQQVDAPVLQDTGPTAGVRCGPHLRLRRPEDRTLRRAGSCCPRTPPPTRSSLAPPPKERTPAGDRQRAAMADALGLRGTSVM